MHRVKASVSFVSTPVIKDKCRSIHRYPPFMIHVPKRHKDDADHNEDVAKVDDVLGCANVLVSTHGDEGHDSAKANQDVPLGMD